MNIINNLHSPRGSQSVSQSILCFGGGSHSHDCLTLQRCVYSHNATDFFPFDQLVVTISNIFLSKLNYMIKSYTIIDKNMDYSVL